MSFLMNLELDPLPRASTYDISIIKFLLKYKFMIDVYKPHYSIVALPSIFKPFRCMTKLYPNTKVVTHT